MFNLKVSKTRIELLEVETITSGAKNAIDVKFCFSEDWKGLTKTAFFRSGKPSREVTASWLLNNENICKIPAEVLTRPNLDLFVGVRGNASTREGGDVVIPTIWAKLGEIKEGANGGDESENITPEEYEKLLGYISNKQDILEGEEGQYVGFDKERHAVAKDFTDTVVSKGEFDEYKQSQEKVLDDKIDTSGGTVTGPLLFVDETSVSSNAPDEEKTEQDVETGESKSGVSYSSGGIYKGTEGPLNIRTVSNHIQFADGQNKSLLSHVQGDNTIPDSVPNFGQLTSSIQQVKGEIPDKVTDLSDADDYSTKKYVVDEIEASIADNTILFGNLSTVPVKDETASLSSEYFVGKKPKVTTGDNTEDGIIMVDGKAYYVKYKITEVISNKVVSIKYTQDGILIGPSESAADELITIKDTEVTNISQLPGCSCCVHAINSDIGFTFKDDIVYLAMLGTEIVVYTIDGSFTTINVDADTGDLTISGTKDDWAKASDVYNKSQVDEKIADISLTPGPDGEDGFSPTVSTSPNETNDGTIVTITDKNGPHSFEVLNGEDGAPGTPGEPGIDGTDGTTFTPYVSQEGVISFTNDGGLPNPDPVNIKGPPGSGADLTFGDGLTKDGSTVSVTTPVNGIFTQEEFDALPQAQQNKGMYVVTEDGDGSGGSSSGGQGDVYSTEEVRIGTWIDGKPLYRKVFTNCPYPATSMVNENFVPGTKAEDLDIETLVKNEFFDVLPFEHTNFPYFIISGSGLCILTHDWYSAFGATLTVIKLNVSASKSFSFTNLHLVLEYTKTTDEPEVTP